MTTGEREIKIGLRNEKIQTWFCVIEVEWWWMRDGVESSGAIGNRYVDVIKQ